MAYQQHGIEKKDRAIAAREEEKGLCGLVYRSVAQAVNLQCLKCVVWSAYRPSITTLLRGSDGEYRRDGEGASAGTRSVESGYRSLGAARGNEEDFVATR